MTKPVIREHKAPRLVVDVTQEIIDRSAVKDSSHCMIAEAIKIAMPTATYIAVDLATLRLTDEAAGFRYIYLTPRTAQSALLDFDQGEKPEPFRFEVSAAQVLPSGTGRRGPSKLVADRGLTAGNVPIKVGGKAPPIGPMATGAGTTTVMRTGRRREFGLRAIIR